jgi:hypothetical protein
MTMAALCALAVLAIGGAVAAAAPLRFDGALHRSE